MNARAQAAAAALPPVAAVSDAAVLSKAVIRAARLLGLTQRDVAAALGISEATASRLFGGKYLLAPEHAKEWELALLLVRLFRSLDALWGHDAPGRLWLNSHNTALGGRPRDLLRTVEGMVRVVAYLDAARGRL